MTTTTICRICHGIIDRPEFTPKPHDAHGVCIIEEGHKRARTRPLRRHK